MIKLIALCLLLGLSLSGESDNLVAAAVLLDNQCDPHTDYGYEIGCPISLEIGVDSI